MRKRRLQCCTFQNKKQRYDLLVKRIKHFWVHARFARSQLFIAAVHAGMMVILRVPRPTITACVAFGANEFLATSTSRSPTLPSSHWGHINIPIPPVWFIKLSDTTCSQRQISVCVWGGGGGGGVGGRV